MGTMMRGVASVIAAVLFGIPAGGAEPHQSAATDQSRIQYSVDVLARDYDAATGLWKTEGWWNAANTVTALANAATVDRRADVRRTLENTFVKAPAKFPGFLNEYYDDEGWWALGWMQVYDLTHQKRFLRQSELIFEDMT